jgi:hypothetical protein
MKAYMLLVTIMVPQQPPSSYQVAFESQATCETARVKVLNDMERVRQETLANSLIGRGTPLPSAMAVCAAIED